MRREAALTYLEAFFQKGVDPFESSLYLYLIDRCTRMILLKRVDWHHDYPSGIMV